MSCGCWPFEQNTQGLEEDAHEGKCDPRDLWGRDLTGSATRPISLDDSAVGFFGFAYLCKDEEVAKWP